MWSFVIKKINLDCTYTMKCKLVAGGSCCFMLWLFLVPDTFYWLNFSFQYTRINTLKRWLDKRIFLFYLFISFQNMWFYYRLGKWVWSFPTHFWLQKRLEALWRNECFLEYFNIEKKLSTWFFQYIYFLLCLKENILKISCQLFIQFILIISKNRY